MSLLSDVLATLFSRTNRNRLQAGPDARSTEALIADLLSGRGEISGMTTAAQILDRYDELDDAGKLAFFDHLAGDLGIDTDAVRSALDAFEMEQSQSTYGAFLRAAEPRRQELARRLNRVPGATPQLVAMRGDLLRLIPRKDPRARIDLDFQHLFASWFNRGFLVLRRINWESPAHILERIIAYEAVHAIDSWEDLRRRVEPSDRRCFAFFHPAMPDEPLVFVEVALTKGIPNSVQGLLKDTRASMEAVEADTAVFYSISNCQAGLAGISFGNSLIKQVTEDLSAELPNLKTFVTLSPIPTLTRWMAEQGIDPNGLDDDGLKAAAAQFLLTAKRDDGMPYDPVARFHLGNGAYVHAVHAGADMSSKGLSESAGAMVNYRYEAESFAENHERFVGQKEVVASKAVRALVKAPVAA
ncbi:malonyl-CoA decarboxylase [Citreicella sp. SE45]|uniref:Malonyl-CoA decarboxylase n=1 Tax=Salipiger thiooxidans TaxID=282683 RepID=A0A1G7FJY9_9RHOB|nr:MULTISPECIES: malonyl-CoA decarboxylase [Salipiger]EEX11711.1 malonyl-CoA decarboxylase [Citreicella sp. SE45]MAU48375.1 decarboxylase [Salipiger sp.]NIY94855.1 malonyl-CoA decarboxylase [Salipiger sp. HF18]SDE76237.1 malonyl-CoA decarboxylase [Salipiger thiooxidans]